jgi:hypothetical protein
VVGAGLPLVEGLPCGLKGTHDCFLEVRAILLHDDDRFLQKIFLVDLFEELTSHKQIDNISIRG